MNPVTQQPTTGKRVLIADDVALWRDLARSVIEAGGYDADVVEDGARAVEAVARQRYDLVLMDIEMPVMDGYAAIRAIRDLPSEHARVPVLALTAKTARDEAERCRRAGMDAYLVKPFDPATLLEQIRRQTLGAAGQPVPDAVTAWDRSVYRELAERLGSVRMGKALAMFEEHLARSLSVLRSAPEDLAVWVTEAHNLVSISGMLGFSAFSEVSRRLMMSDSVAEAVPVLRELASAGDGVLALLRTEIQAAPV